MRLLTPLRRFPAILRAARPAWVTKRRVRVAAGLTLGLVVVACADVVIGTPNPEQIRTLVHMPQATTVYDIHGQLAFTIFKERRIAVPLTEVSPNIVKAVLAIEDQRFYDHYGVDPWRICGAILANLRHGESLQGGSTITQQLARKSFLTDEKTLRRKLKEAYLALRIERHFTKDQILELYLNKVYFGDGYYGIEAASRGYFGKPAKSIEIGEAALLVGLIQAPSHYAPTGHLDRATARRAVVLRQMVGAGFLDAPTSAKIAASPVMLVDGFGQERSGQYFKNHIARLLIDEVGWERLSQGGLRVFATIDTAVQIAAERAVVRGLDRAEQLRGFKHPKRGDPRTIHAGSSPSYLQGALVAIDPTSGEVRAMTGGRNFNESQYNRAMQMERQAGSAFKPIVYAAAIESGYTPATLVTDLDAPMQLPDGAWLPDDGHSRSSSMTLRTALRTSSNRAAVQVLRAVGIPAAVNYAHRLGLAAPPVPSLVLGTGDVSVLSMAVAYGAFANGGFMREPVFIRRVEDAEGRVIFSAKPKAVPVISEDTAFLMANMLADVVNSGTGFRAREAGFQFAAGGKTGTTNEYRDAWFIGFTPVLVTSVWVGFDQPQTILPGGYASELAVPIWGRFMKDAAGTTDTGWVKRPADIVSVEICRLTGALPTEGCRRATALNDRGEITARSSVGVEYFQIGTEPVDECSIHGDGSFSGARRSIIGSASFPARPIEGLVPPIAPVALKQQIPGILKTAAPPPPKPVGRSGGGG